MSSCNIVTIPDLSCDRVALELSQLLLFAELGTLTAPILSYPASDKPLPVRFDQIEQIDLHAVCAKEKRTMFELFCRHELQRSLSWLLFWTRILLIELPASRNSGQGTPTGHFFDSSSFD